MVSIVHGVAKSQTRLSNFHFSFTLRSVSVSLSVGTGEADICWRPVFWRIPGTGEPLGCRLWGHAESHTTEAAQQQQQQQQCRLSKMQRTLGFLLEGRTALFFLRFW